MRAKRKEHQFKLDQHKSPRIFLFERQVNFITKNSAILGWGGNSMHEGTETFKNVIYLETGSR